MHLISEVSQWLLFFWKLLRENLTLTQSDIDTKTFYWSHKGSRWILEHNNPEQMVKAGKLVIRWFLVPLSPWQFILGLVSLFMWQDQITVLVLPNFSVLIKAQYQKFFFYLWPSPGLYHSALNTVPSVFYNNIIVSFVVLDKQVCSFSHMSN